MHRTFYQELLNWKQSKKHKPLLLEGARQVGKTYLIQEFGKKEYPEVIYLNFEQDPALANLFSKTLEPSVLLQNITLYTRRRIIPEDTLLVFDEVQECPPALNSLKYFQEQAPQYSIIAAGSLLGVKLANSKGFPVGKVDFMTLYPLTFLEFLEALDEKTLVEHLQTTRIQSALPDAIHDKLLEYIKRYFIIGGMPEAVQIFVEKQDFDAVRHVHANILKSYVYDFAKHADPHQTMRITAVWEAIPSQLAKENKKFIFSVLRKGARGQEYEVALAWLAQAGLIHLCHRVTAPKSPLLSYKDPHAFKVYSLDVGLLSTMNQVPFPMLLEQYRLLTEWKGALTENFVAQELIAYGKKPLVYWASEGMAEVDFLVQHEACVVPLEVKSGTSQHKKSLQVYAQKYHPPLIFRTSPLNFSRHEKFINLPLYLLNQFPLLTLNPSYLIIISFIISLVPPPILSSLASLK